jgi:hypothetical protein
MITIYGIPTNAPEQKTKAGNAVARPASVNGESRILLDDQPPKSSSMMFSLSTPMSSSILMTAEFIMGGPHR